MINYKLFYLCFVLLFFSVGAFSQCKITGCAKLENSLEGACISVKLLNNDSVFIASVSTDTLGYFSFNDVPAKHYIVAYSHIGYKTCYRTFEIIEPYTQFPTIYLQEDNLFLNEVKVQASSFIRKKDYLLVIPSKQQIKHSYTGYDLLYNLMIPGVDVDRSTGNVSALNGSTTLYIDGRKADAREIKHLRPRDIEKIEYYDSPSGRFSGDNTSINYVTKTSEFGGYLALDAKQTVGYMSGEYNVATKLVSNNTSFTLFAGYGMEDYAGSKAQNDEIFKFSAYEIKRNNNGIHSEVKNHTQYEQLNIMNRNKRRTLLAKLSFVHNNQPKQYNINVLEYDGGLKTESRKQSKQKNMMPSLCLYGNFNVDSTQYVEASFDASYADNHYQYDYMENSTSLVKVANENMYGLNMELKYGINLKKQNSLNIKFYHHHNISLSTYSSETDLWQHLWTGETLLFSEYSQRIKGKTFFRIAPGVSMLQYKLHGEKRICKISPRLHFTLGYQPSHRDILQFRINVGNSFPNINMLSSTSQEVDFLQMRKGNPNLKTTTAYHFMGIYAINWKKVNLQVVGMYQLFKNMYTYDYFVEHDKLIQSFRSDIDWQQVTGMLSFTWKPIERLHLKLDGNNSLSQFSRGVNKRLNSWNGGMQINYYCGDFLISLFGKTENSVLGYDLAKVHIPACYGMFVNWSKKNWLVEGSISNPFYFNRRYVASFQDVAFGYHNSMTPKKEQMSGYIKVAYTFDFLNKTSHDAKDVKTKINSAILKVD
ncbi:hypothetical protein [Paraprevotella xylaniphila]|uniref:hypothetical protein n=1 Tax=Paraprevotella xylaniphila TaxID=454155 RepID=UPI0024A9F32A|nr:hypothetical protein [Paraprevotella xylaniphila]